MTDHAPPPRPAAGPADDARLEHAGEYFAGRFRRHAQGQQRSWTAADQIMVKNLLEDAEAQRERARRAEAALGEVAGSLMDRITRCCSSEAGQRFCASWGCETLMDVLDEIPGECLRGAGREGDHG